MDISAFRNRMGLSQAELAERLGLATSSVGNLCSGTKKPSYEIIERLFMLGARVEEVFSHEVGDAVCRNEGPRLVSMDDSNFEVSPEMAEKIVGMGLFRIAKKYG